MTTFAIVAPAASTALTAAMERVFGLENIFQFAPGQFVAVAQNLTSKQVGERLGPKGEVGHAF